MLTDIIIILKGKNYGEFKEDAQDHERWRRLG